MGNDDLDVTAAGEAPGAAAVSSNQSAAPPVQMEAVARDTLRRVMDQAETDLKVAHAEICKLQGLDPATHSWPEWSSPANTLRWFKEIRSEMAQVSASPVPSSERDDIIEMCAKEMRRLIDENRKIVGLTHGAWSRGYDRGLVDAEHAIRSLKSQPAQTGEGSP